MSYSGYEEEEPVYEQRLEGESPLGHPEQPQVIVESPLVQHDPSLTSAIGLAPNNHQQQDPTSDLNVSILCFQIGVDQFDIFRYLFTKGVGNGPSRSRTCFF